MSFPIEEDKERDTDKRYIQKKVSKAPAFGILCFFVSWDSLLMLCCPSTSISKLFLIVWSQFGASEPELVHFGCRVGRKMETLKGPVCHHSAIVRANCVGSFSSLTNISFAKARDLESGFWRSSGRYKSLTRTFGLFLLPHEKKIWPVCSSFSSSSDGNGSIAGNFSENDEEYVSSSVIEAVEVRSGSDGLMIKMRDGQQLKCVQNDPQAGNSLYYPPNPAIVLKMEDGSDILLPILVMEMPSTLLMAAICDIQLVRPTIYELVKEMIEKMGYAAQLVRVTKRVGEAYCAQLYLAKIESEKETISFDLRPSDAINMAVRCKVPIQVNRLIAYSDGMRVVEPAKSVVPTSPSDSTLFTELDRPDGKPCYVTTEFNLVRNMLIAAVEERYKDAAMWRNKLYLLRANKKNWSWP